MEPVLVLIFVLGYLAITLEHPLKLDKTVPALLMAVIMWAVLTCGFREGWFSIINGEGEVFSFTPETAEASMAGLNAIILHHLGKAAEILIFLIGAMTIVEIIDLHQGFGILKGAVRTQSKCKLLWITGIGGFVLSSVIDNLTATIILVTLLRKLISSREERIWYVSLVVIAANAGGAWSPIGDVTTTMLWIANKVSATHLVLYTVLPSVICFAVPFGIASFLPVFRGNLSVDNESDLEEERLLSSRTMLWLGLGAIVSVPVFKALVHLPPYMGIMLGLGIVWAVSESIHPERDFKQARRYLYSSNRALSKIEMSSILFFWGILMAVGVLESLVYGSVGGEPMGALRYMAESLRTVIPNENIVVLLLGMLSSVVDNVPLVAASIGMYNDPLNAPVWQFIALSAGTGGSLLIIGSAAGVAAMGMEKIDFLWYLKRVSWLALIGFFAGAGVFLAMA
ncbi:sodium:proton antiporter NhaD [Ruficoccus amylovorans]|uniref:Sodium:proton antiporter NhaD n=1 Tax=Ruficoccus amylovorans TaxID=1804625 RepID=A0A842HA35_9BACT|nr:sodium:proton antiporter NhaD [Ruficoccus amylovorans]MBC2592958.1 sodium:proton antiporter NhaD [Ruficoccus amylovorans]